MLGNSGGSFLSKRDCLHSTKVLEREGTICAEEKDGADIPDLQFFQICMNLRKLPSERVFVSDIKSF